MKEKELYLLTYDHGGYVLWKDRVKPRLNDIDQWMEKYPKLRIGLDYESFTFDEFSRCDPEVVEKIAYLLKKYPDRIGLGATTYGQPLSLTISEESNARQLSYAVRTNLEYFGVTPSVYAISEFALNNQTPQLISQCGYKAAILRSHVMGYGYPRTFNSAWGRWVGKDGTEIPAVPTYDKQGRGFNCTTLDNWILSRWPDEGIQSIEEFEEMFSEYSPLLASRYDDLTQSIEELTKYLETKDNVKYVLLEDIPEIYGEAVEELKTTDNDFHVQMPWGYCGNEIFNGVRASEVAAVQAEKLNALSVMLSGLPMYKKTDEAWKYSLAAQHHDVTICGLLDLSRRFIPASLDAATEVKTQSLETIKALFAKEDTETLLLFNLHSFAVCDWVEIETDKKYAVSDNENSVEYENIEKDGKNYLRVFVELKPLTIKRYSLTETNAVEDKSEFSWDENSGELCTPYYKLSLNEKGISYIADVNGERFVDNSDGELFTAFVDGKDCKSVGKWSVTLNNHSATAVHNGMIGTIPFSLEMNFSTGKREIDCKTRFELHSEHVGKDGECNGLRKSITVDGHRHADKLNLILNLNLDKNRRMFRDLPYSISEWSGDVRKTEDYWYGEDYILVDTPVSAEESFNGETYMQGIYWLALRDENKGLAVMNRGCMGGAVYGNRLEIPLLYSNLYLCGTRILDGIYDDEFSLLPFGKETSQADIHRRAVLYNYPVTSVINAKGEGKMSELSIADVDACGGEVILTTFYPEDGNILVRFCNYSDEASIVNFKPNIGTVDCEVDLLGNEVKNIENSALDFRPWEIKTVRIKL